MPGPLRVSPRLEIPEEELQVRFSRSSGPGGQSVNTSNSRVELSFDVSNSPTLPDYLRTRLRERLDARLVNGVLTVSSSEERSQLRNRTAAERRMAELLAEAAAPPPPKRRPTKPSASAKRNRLDTKRQRGDIKRLRRSTEE